ncbi:MAG: hypothetical protein GY855_15475, partial [candidate division Zixibacteria bacterium]|nr:hypothetical protein [candidate division Zixibacteria bacterium]
MRLEQSKYPFRLICLGFLISVLFVLNFIKPVSLFAADYEEIVVDFKVPHLIEKDLFVLYSNDTLYVPIVEILNTLGLNIVSDISNRKLYGFLFTKNNNYRFDLENGIFKSSWIEYN